MLSALKSFPKSAIFALVGIAFMVFYVINSNKVPPQNKPLRQPPQKPYEAAIVGTGLIEGQGENLSIMPYTAGKVTAVWVRQGQQVKPGQALYQLDNALWQAQLASAQSDRHAAEARLDQLIHMPRPEDVAPLQAAKAQAEAQYQEALQYQNRLESVRLESVQGSAPDNQAISAQELSQSRLKTQALKAQLGQAQAELARLKAGAWKYDIQQAKAQLQGSAQRVKQLQVQCEQSVVRAPRINGAEAFEVLQVNAHEGEFVSTVAGASAPVVLGNTTQLQVRVDIDEDSASRVKPNMPAKAAIKGDPDKTFPLVFKRIDPLMVPKRNLSGSNLERVDIRVLQLVYTFQRPEFPVYVGQQVDVFLEN